MLAIFFALREEIKPLLKEIKVEARLTVRPATILKGYWRKFPLCLVQTGVGKENGRRSAEQLCRYYRPHLALLTGYAGGLQTALLRGDLVIPQEVYDEAGSKLTPDAPATKKMRDLLRTGTTTFHEGKLLTVRRTLNRADEKMRAGDRGFLAADMESHAEGVALSNANIPFAALRIIFDPAETNLEFDSEHILEELVRKPERLLDLPNLWQANRLCQQKLCEVLIKIIPILSIS